MTSFVGSANLEASCGDSDSEVFYDTTEAYLYTKPMDLLNSRKLVTVCGPMVRYSKLAFRTLVRKYECDIAFTPMIVCRSFVQSTKARDNEFTTNPRDRPLIVQFAARDAKNLADGAEIVYPDADGVDLNCGCPQKWALNEGYGASLLNNPELVRDMVRQVRNRVPDPEFTTSLKIRIHEDIRKTVEFCRRAEKAGVSFIAVHARTVDQRTEPVNIEAIKTIKAGISIPIIGNGDISSIGDALNLYENTGINGVMAARGLLENPTLFSGTHLTSRRCVKDWLEICFALGISFTTLHQHLMFMMSKVLPRSERKAFNMMTSTSAVLDYLDQLIP